MNKLSCLLAAVCLLLTTFLPTTIHGQIWNPHINYIQPTSGPVGTLVTIHGYNFCRSLDSTAIFFGPVKGTIVSLGDSVIQVKVPAGATFQQVSLMSRFEVVKSSEFFTVTFPGAGGEFLPGSFLPKINLATGYYPHSVEFGDFNGDGKSDLVVSRGSSDRLMIFKNTSAAGALTFNSKSEQTTAGQNNEGSVVADFDGYGSLDIAVLNSIPGRLTVFFNNSRQQSNDTFTARREVYNAGSGAYCLAAGDLNNDGYLDLAAAENGGTRILVFRNRPYSYPLQFDTLSFPGGPAPYGIAIYDIDGDGKQDFIVSTQSSGSKVSILRNISHGDTLMFAAPQSIATLPGPFTLTIGDMDGDGKADIVAAGSSNTASVIRNTSTPGNLSFDPQKDFLTHNYPVCIALGDLDGDGKVDMVSANRFGNTISVMKNISTPGNLQFSPAVNYETGEDPVFVAIGDIDGDSKPDIAVANSSDSTVSIFKNIHGLNITPSIQSFMPVSAFSGNIVTIKGNNFQNATAVSFGGINAAVYTVLSDSIIEATLANGKSGDVKVSTPLGESSKAGFTFTGPDISSFLPISAKQGTSITITGTNFNQVTAVHFGGIPARSYNVISPTTIKAVVDYGNTGFVTVITDNGSAQLNGFSFAQPMLTSFYPQSGPVGTVIRIHTENIPPSPDSTIVHFGAVKAKVIGIAGDTLYAEVPAGSTYKSITLTSNRLVAHSRIPFVTTFPNDSLDISDKTFVLTGNYPVGAFPRAIETEDFDSDGKPDLVVVNGSSNNISILKNNSSNGAFSFAGNQTYTAGSQPIRIAVADLDGDGRKDIIVSNFNGGLASTISVFRNMSTWNAISFAAKTDYATGNGTVGIATGDFNDDGKTDIATASGNSGIISFFINATLPGGKITFNTKQDRVSGGQVNNIVATDIDYDNKPDLVATNSSSKLLLVYRNQSVNGSLTFATPASFTTGNFPGSLAAGDLDGNGKPDIIVSNYSDGTATTWLNYSNTTILSFQPKQTFKLNTTVPALGDLNGDAKPELVAGKYVDGRVTVLTNILSSFETSPFRDSIHFKAGEFDSYVSICDLDGDGKADIAVANAQSGSVKILHNRSATPAIYYISPATAPEGATVKIYGYRLSQVSSVSFGGVPARSFTVVSAYEINAIVSSGSSGIVEVSGSAGTGSFSQFGFVPDVIAEDSVQFCAGGLVTLRSTDNNNNQWYRNNVLIPGATGNRLIAKEPGIYTVQTSMDSIKMTSRNRVVVRVWGGERPFIQMDTSRNLVSYGSSIGQWYLNGNAIPGETLHWHKPVSDGLYTFRSNYNGCASELSDPYVYKNVNLIELGSNQHINMYPNPAISDMRIVWQIDGNPKMNIEITDAQGRPVIFKPEMYSGGTISLYGLKKGVYYIRIYNLSMKVSSSTIILKQ